MCMEFIPLTHCNGAQGRTLQNECAAMSSAYIVCNSVSEGALHTTWDPPSSVRQKTLSPMPSKLQEEVTWGDYRRPFCVNSSLDRDACKTLVRVQGTGSAYSSLLAGKKAKAAGGEFHLSLCTSSALCEGRGAFLPLLTCIWSHWMSRGRWCAHSITAVCLQKA